MLQRRVLNTHDFVIVTVVRVRPIEHASFFDPAGP